MNIITLLNSEVLEKKLPIQSSLSLIVGIDHAHKSFSKSNISTFIEPFAEISSKIILNINMTELRQIQLDALEQALSSLENVCASYYGRNSQCGQLVEPLYYDVAMILANSPYLNKRHGGLKILSDLLRRAQNYIETPNGLKITKSYNSNSIETISYKAVPILHHFKLDELCRKITASDIIKNMFIGELSHESLMTKSIDILKPMAQEGYIDVNIINAFHHFC
jgi:hypothetical protein